MATVTAAVVSYALVKAGSLILCSHVQVPKFIERASLFVVAIGAGLLFT